jgi:hypothetical protein
MVAACCVCGCLQVNTDCDEFGDTALHMCVIHDQADMMIS